MLGPIRGAVYCVRLGSLAPHAGQSSATGRNLRISYQVGQKWLTLPRGSPPKEAGVRTVSVSVEGSCSRPAILLEWTT